MEYITIVHDWAGVIPFGFSESGINLKFERKNVIEVLDDDVTEHVIYYCVRSKLSHLGSVVVVGLIAVEGSLAQPASRGSVLGKTQRFEVGIRGIAGGCLATS